MQTEKQESEKAGDYSEESAGNFSRILFLFSRAGTERYTLRPHRVQRIKNRHSIENEEVK